MKLKRMCISAVITAAIFILTAYLHIPVGSGYVHMGDSLIYLVACILPLPYAVFSAGVGALLADVLTGYALWAPCSVVIKVITVFFFTSKNRKVLCPRNLSALLPSAVLCVVGYYLYEAAISGNLIAPLPFMLGNLIQSAVSTVIFLCIGYAVDRSKLIGKFL